MELALFIAFWVVYLLIALGYLRLVCVNGSPKPWQIIRAIFWIPTLVISLLFALGVVIGSWIEA